MDLQKVDVEIKWPFKLFLGGGSGVGKTTFCVKFIKNLKKKFVAFLHLTFFYYIMNTNHSMMK